jgi:hypothetical protein
MEQEKKEDAAQRTVPRDVHQTMILDEWPSEAGVVDFGLASQDHYAALQYAVRYDDVTVEQLDEALGSGRRIQALISERNPYRHVVFRTDWDDMPEEPDSEADE